jgi:hypothetical protein
MNELQKPYVSVIDPITTAIQRVKLILFDPFEIEKWFIIGFCAWLAFLGEGGGSSMPSGGGQSGGGGHPGDFIAEHLAIIIIVVAVILVIGFAIGIVLTWLSSRGRFMFLHCVAENKAQVKFPWRQYRRQGNSLFLFRLALMFIGLLCFGLLIGGGIVLGIVFGRAGSLAGVIVTIIIAVPLFLVLLVVFGVIGKFLKDFVVPIMYIEKSTCMESWRRFMQLLSVNKGRFVLYILFQIVIGMAISAIVLAAILVTCCCAACILGIPYIGTVLMLPILVFRRSYSLYYLGQYGPEFDVFARAQYEASPDEFGPAAV